MVGLIHPSKGQLEAVDALHLLDAGGVDARLVIAGNGRDKELRSRMEALGLRGRVELTGFVEDPFSLFHTADAFLMCSRNEAMGRVTVEAMACALPVIGHASGGTLEILHDNVDGLLYPGGPEALAERMKRVATDHRLAVELGRTAARSAAERFSVERYASEVLDVYRSVLSPRTQ
jgi:glycosyltransferase involved in cell wall biosynthesis